MLYWVCGFDPQPRTNCEGRCSLTGLTIGRAAFFLAGIRLSISVIHPSKVENDALRSPRMPLKYKRGRR